MAKKQIKHKISLANLRTKYAGSGVLADIRVEENMELWVPCSSPAINHLLGGGIAYGRIIEIAGKEASGKSLMAMDFVRSAQLLGGVGIYVDAEMAFSTSWAEKNGIDLENLYLYPENAIELISDFVAESCLYYRSQLTMNEPIVLVIDSIAVLETLTAMNSSESDSKAEMGGRAKAIYKMLRLRNRLWAKLGITVILINQLRDTIATGFAAKFAEKTTTPGGNALKFYASQRLYLEAKKQLVEKVGGGKHRYGVEVEVTVKKNKLSIPKAPQRISVIFDPGYGVLGFSRYENLAESLLRDEVFTKQGNTFYLNGESVGNGLSQVQHRLETERDFRNQVLEVAKIPTVGSMNKRLDLITENLYPVDTMSFVPQSNSSSEPEEEDDDE